MPVQSRPNICGLTDHYEIEQRIGKGGFGTVYKATHNITGETVAVKVMNKESIALKNDLPRVKQEINVLKTLDHPNICKIFKDGEDDKFIFIVMEYCPGGELFDYLVSRERLSENEARRILIDILRSVCYLHENDIAHRDLKPENVLLDFNNNIKLIDFGLCSNSTNLCETPCGSYAYADPTLYTEKQYDAKLADVWSLGVILYTLLTGRLPFEGNDNEIAYKAKNEPYFEPKWLSEGPKSILRSMLTKTQKNRLTSKELLEHTWCLAGMDQTKGSSDFYISRSLLGGEFDEEVLQIMAEGLGRDIQEIKRSLIKRNYRLEETATYLILCERKRFCGSRFKFIPLNPNRILPPPQHRHLSVKKSLETDFSNCDSIDNNQTPVRSPRKYHTSMEGGLDDVNLLEFASPKSKDKEKGNEEFARPRVPSPRKQKPAESIAFPTGNITSAKSADSGLNDTPKTPVRERWMAVEPHTPVPSYPSPSPSRRKMMGSIERGLNKVKNMLTPRSTKIKRPKTLKYNGRKEAYNITCTAATDADCVLDQLKYSLEQLGATYKDNGYRLVGKWQERGGADNSFTGRQVKFELEVMLVSENVPMAGVGIRRKRVNGDAWLYKSIVEQILNLTGVCRLPSKDDEPIANEPTRLQTMV